MLDPDPYRDNITPSAAAAIREPNISYFNDAQASGLRGGDSSSSIDTITPFAKTKQQRL